MVGADADTAEDEPTSKETAMVHKRLFGTDGKLRILQITDLHIMDIDRGFSGTDVPRLWRELFGDSAACLDRTLALIRRAIIDQDIHVVIMTGDIVDARSAQTLDEFMNEFLPLADLCAELGTPWLYIPGNHEDGHGESYARADLQKLFSLPGSLCKPGWFDSFDQCHALRIGEDGVIQGVAIVQLVDARWTPKTCFISQSQVDVLQQGIRQNMSMLDSEASQLTTARIAFAHEPFDSFADSSIPVARGHSEYPPKQKMEDSGYLEFLRSENFHGMFAGHNHHNDFIRWTGSADDLWLGHGRCGSYFPPSTWEDRYPLPFNRGARVFEIDTQEHALHTWVYDEDIGVDKSSFLSRAL